MSALRPSCSTTLLSFSRTLIAYHLFSASGMLDGSSASIALTLSSTLPSKIALTVPAAWLFATLIASAITSFRPVFFSAEVSMIGQPSFLDSAFTSMLMPFFFRRSHIFKAITTGIPVSISCVVRYRLRSMLVASTKSTMTSGFSFKIKSRVTTSSSVYGERE